MQTFMNKVQDFNLKMKKRYWDFHRKSEQNKNYVTILFFDLVFNKKRKQSRPNRCSYEKKVKHMKKKQSTTTYSKLVNLMATWELAATKIMVHSFAVLYFLATYLRIVPDRAYVLLALLLKVQ